MPHAKLAPSAAGRWVFCPGAPSMEERFPETERSEPAEEGTASHWVSSEQLLGNPVPEEGQTAPNGIILTREMIESAGVYVEAVCRAVPPGVPIYVEQKVQIPRIHGECYGTPDLFYFIPDLRELHIWDYKFGFGIVEPFENWQGICYASGALELFNGATPMGVFDQGVTVVIHTVQPRPFHSGGPVRDWRIDASGLLRGYTNRLAAAAAEAMSPNPKCNSGNYCRYCSARHACPAAQKAAMFAIDYTDQAAPVDLSPEALAIELRTLQRAANAIAYRLTGLESQAIGVINGGGFVPGFALENGTGRPTWTGGPEEVFALGDLFGVDLHKPDEPITPAQAKKAGVPAEIVAVYSKSHSSGMKLVTTNNTLAAQVFKGGS